VSLALSDGAVGRALVPSGASKGLHEALELRDGDKKRFLGRGTQKAVANVSEVIGPKLKGKSFSNVQEIDSLMLEWDGTQQKEKLGANSMLGVSLAFVNAVAVSQKRPLFLVLNEMMGLSSSELSLPVPLMNILNGGLHANNGLEVQEFMIVPHGFSKFSEGLRAGTEVFQHLKNILHDKHLSTAVGDEGGFAPALKSNEDALLIIIEAIKAAGYQLGSQIALAMDVAASSFYDSGIKKYKIRQGDLTNTEMIQFYSSLVDKFPIVSIEDGLEEEDWSGWAKLTQTLGEKTQLVGDDLFVTQASRVKKGISEKVANSVLIKVNQVGTLKETFETMLLCRKNNYTAVTSHRSGETEDVSIAHLAVGSGCGQIKTGSASRSERTAKYNELLRIEKYAEENGIKLPLANPFR
jgi:enolase